jgi:hypothetical protein
MSASAEEISSLLDDAMFELRWLANIVDPEEGMGEFNDARKLCDKYEKMKKDGGLAAFYLVRHRNLCDKYEKMKKEENKV